MFNRIISSAILAILFGLASVGPSEARSMNLMDLANKTVCPITVHTNFNPDRIPQRIKELKCAQDQRDCCQQAHECCSHRDSGLVMECVEVRDTVLVFDKIKNGMVTLEVSVGCSCVVGKSKAAETLSISPSR